jgi:hypothetical protein
MALFNTPSLLDVIWRKETFPEDGGGFAGLMEGLSSGMGVGKQYKADKGAWDKTQQGKSTKNWGEVGKSNLPKPNAFQYFLGQGANPQASSYYGGKGGAPASPAFTQPTVQPQWPQSGIGSGVQEPHSAIDGLFRMLMEALGSGNKSMMLPR